MQLLVSPNMECVYVALRVGISPQNFLYQAISRVARGGFRGFS